MATAPAPLAIAALRERLFDGLAIPAHPLALDSSRRLDRRRQRALARYYLDAGAGGLAVGVHTTQFAIREAGLFEQVLTIAAETARDGRASAPADAPRPLLVAGACGRTQQARRRGAPRARPRLRRRAAEPRRARRARARTS